MVRGAPVMPRSRDDGRVVVQRRVVLIARAAALVLRGARRVDVGEVGVTAAQRARRDHEPVERRHGGELRDVDIERRARGDELVRAQVADRHADLLRPALDEPLVVRDLGHRVVDRRAQPALAVVDVEVLGLPVRGLAGAHAQQLAAVARPVQPGVGVLPVERRRLRRGGLGRPRLVVEPRRVAVDHRRGGERDERGQERDPGRRHRVGAAQLLQPQEGDHQQREDGAADELAGEVERDHRDHVEDDQQQQREDREPEPVAARPEREHRGGGDQHGAADRDVGPHPRVEAAVGHAHARQVGDAARDAARELAPPARQQQLVGHPAAISASANSGISASVATTYRRRPSSRPAASITPAAINPTSRTVQPRLGSAGSSIDIQCSTPQPASAVNAISRASQTGRSGSPPAARSARA